MHFGREPGGLARASVGRLIASRPGLTLRSCFSSRLLRPPCLSLAVIIFYYIYGNISIDGIDIFTGIYLSIISIYGSRFVRYNIATMGGEGKVFAAPERSGVHGGVEGAAARRTQIRQGQL